MVEPDLASSLVDAAAIIVGGLFVATLGYLYGRRHDVDFSLIDKLWEKKSQGFEQISIAIVRGPQLLTLMHDLLMSRARTKSQRDDLYDILTTADILKRFHGTALNPDLEKILDIPGEFDSYINSKTPQQLDSDITILADELIHEIQYELSTMSKNIAQLTYSLNLIMEDNAILDETRQQISDYIDASNRMISTGQDISAIMVLCERRGQEIQDRAIMELDRTRTARLRKHWWTRLSRYGELYLSPDVEEWLIKNVSNGNFTSKSEAVAVCILQRMNEESKIN